MKYILLFFCLLPFMVSGQVNETFESGIPGNWVQSPSDRWDSDTIGSLSGKFSLYHIFDNHEAACDIIACPVSGLSPALSETVWQFKIKHAYSPSSSNNWAFILMSDISLSEINTEGDMSGFLIGVNHTGYDDTLRIWKLLEGNPEILMNCSINWQTDIGIDSIASIKVVRSMNGEWRVYLSDSDDIETLIGLAADPQLFPVNWMGISYKYTSSKDRLLWVDDIIVDGSWIRDTIMPEIDSCWIKSANSIAVLFSEEIVADSLTKDSFMLSPGNINPQQVLVINSQRVDMIFYDALLNKTTYDLFVNQICDMSANCSSSFYANIMLAIPEWGDIIISEIMPDPEPAVALPEIEYIEIFNRSIFDFDEGSFMLILNNKHIDLYGSSIRAGEHLLIIHDKDSSFFSGEMNLCYSENSLALNNTGGLIIITDSSANSLHGLNYSKKWYRSQLKSEGGWSLEIIDYNYPFSGALNWSATINRSGGTPAELNSVADDNPDLEQPELLSVYPDLPDKISVSFSEPVSHNALDKALWTLGDIEIDSICSAGYMMTDFILYLSEPLESGLIYKLEFDESIVDQSENRFIKTIYNLGLPIKAAASDIIFNELLYDPLPWADEFIEFYNRSQKIVDMHDLLIVSINSETNDTGKLIFVSEVPRCMFPGDYYAITESRKALIETYFSAKPENIFEIVSLPSLPNNSGSLLLYNRELTLIDKLTYDESMHLDILSSTDGISLERINPDLNSADNNNWQSAAATSGFATPGDRNSLNIHNPVDQGEIIALSSRKISPDNDGFEDNLLISIETDSEINIITVIVFDDHGYPLITLAENLTAGRSSKLSWDGHDKNGALAAEGIYILWFRIIGDDRRVEIHKKVCTVLYNH